MITIIFESHATSLDNEAGLSSGWYDVGLSDLGRKQARELGDRYTNLVLDAVFCSDLKRSYITAEIAFTSRGFAIIKDKRLRECNYGDLTRQSSSELEPQRGKFISQPFPNGQSYEETTVLMKSFLEDLQQRYDGKTVMIVGSRATQYGLENLINGVSLHKAVTDHWAWQPGWIYNLKI